LTALIVALDYLGLLPDRRIDEAARWGGQVPALGDSVGEVLNAP
jgi:hypothetical protein